MFEVCHSRHRPCIWPFPTFASLLKESHFSIKQKPWKAPHKLFEISWNDHPFWYNWAKASVCLFVSSLIDRVSSPMLFRRHWVAIGRSGRLFCLFHATSLRFEPEVRLPLWESKLLCVADEWNSGQLQVSSDAYELNVVWTGLENNTALFGKPGQLNRNIFLVTFKTTDKQNPFVNTI